MESVFNLIETKETGWPGDEAVIVCHRAFPTALGAGRWAGTYSEQVSIPSVVISGEFFSALIGSLLGEDLGCQCQNHGTLACFPPMPKDNLSTQYQHPTASSKFCVLNLKVPWLCCLFLLSLDGGMSGYQEVQVLFL